MQLATRHSRALSGQQRTQPAMHRVKNSSVEHGVQKDYARRAAGHFEKQDFTVQDFSQMTDETWCPHCSHTRRRNRRDDRDTTQVHTRDATRVQTCRVRRLSALRVSRRYGSPFPPSLELSRVRICLRNRRLYANVLSTWDQQGKTLRADHGGPRPRVCSCGSQRRARRRLQTETGRGEVVWNVQL